MSPAESSGQGEVFVTGVDRVATLWLSNPRKRNAMSIGMWRRMAELIHELADDPGVHVVSVRGTGGFFCAGADIGAVAATHGPTGESVDSMRLAVSSATDALASMSKPTVAVIQGPCIGGGCAIAMACDIRVADRTVRVGVPAARLGVIYPAGDVARLLSVAGVSATKYLLFTARVVGCEKAMDLGLIDEVYETNSFDDQVDEFCNALAAQSLLTQSAAKEAIDQWVQSGTIDDSLQRRWEAESDGSVDRQEGILAFQQDRPAVFEWARPRSPTTDQ